MIKVRYSKVNGRCMLREPLTSGMVGQPIHFEYSHDFDGLALTAVFTDGKNTVDVVNPGNECIIPHEVLTTVGATVKVGIYATRGEELVIPTIYAHIGVVLKGADPSGDVSADPTLPVWVQTQALIGNLSQIETEAKDSLVAAINEVKQTADRKANAADLAPVATSGSYNDLTDKPTIPSVPTATINANAAARHEHSNKTVLDLISETVKAAWDAASTWVTTNGANVLSHLSDGVRHITATERSAWNAKQDKLIAGDNITIAADGKTISATGGGGGGSTVELDTTLSEAGKAADAKAVGDRIEVIEGKEAGWDNKQDKLIAGENITIAEDGKTISATNPVPKPLTYDYMPEGYPTKAMGTATVMEEQEVAFASAGKGVYYSPLSTVLYIVEGQTYTVKWDGTEYECVGFAMGSDLGLGNLSILDMGEDTGVPFLYFYGSIFTLNTSASHTISIKTTREIVTPIAEEFIPSGVTTTIENAHTAADSAQAATYITKEVLDCAFSSVATFTFDKQTSGRDTFNFNAYDYYKISGFNPAPENVTSFKGTRESGDEMSSITIGNNCVEYGLFIVVASAGDCSLPITETDTMSFTAPSAGLYARYNENNAAMTAGTGKFTLRESTGSFLITGLLLKSSTADSTKKFKITVDDSGTLSATEVTA